MRRIGCDLSVHRLHIPWNPVPYLGSRYLIAKLALGSVQAGNPHHFGAYVATTPIYCFNIDDRISSLAPYFTVGSALESQFGYWQTQFSNRKRQNTHCHSDHELAQTMP